MIVASDSKSKVSSYKDLLVWKRSIELATNIFAVTKNYPKEQQYGLVSQIERSAVSIASNIAEGAGRKGKKEFVQFVSIARGSLFELETQLIISEQTGFINKEKLNYFIKEIDEIGKMLSGLKRSLET